MKVIQWWKLPSDESYLVMKVKIVKEVKRSDGLWRFACGDVLYEAAKTFGYQFNFYLSTGKEFIPAMGEINPKSGARLV